MLQEVASPFHHFLPCAPVLLQLHRMKSNLAKREWGEQARSRHISSLNRQRCSEELLLTDLMAVQSLSVRIATCALSSSPVTASYVSSRSEISFSSFIFWYFPKKINFPNIQVPKSYLPLIWQYWMYLIGFCTDHIFFSLSTKKVTPLQHKWKSPVEPQIHLSPGLL